MITLDFVTALPTVPAMDTPWAIEGFDAFDAVLTTTCKASKRKLCSLIYDVQNQRRRSRHCRGECCCCLRVTYWPTISHSPTLLHADSFHLGFPLRKPGDPGVEIQVRWLRMTSSGLGNSIVWNLRSSVLDYFITFT